MITIVNETPVPAPKIKSLEVRTDNSALMLISFAEGWGHATLKQQSPLSGEGRDYVWDVAGLRELARALRQAADIMEAGNPGEHPLS